MTNESGSKAAVGLKPVRPSRFSRSICIYQYSTLNMNLSRATDFTCYYVM
jgi:hypothetical protein